VIDKRGTKDLVVLLGTPNAESSKLYGLTVTEGDPAWAGVLAGVSLELPVYHIMEPEIKSQVDTRIYEEQVGITEMVLDTDQIIESLQKVRESRG
jgi:betaine reductase